MTADDKRPAQQFYRTWAAAGGQTGSPCHLKWHLFTYLNWFLTMQK